MRRPVIEQIPTTGVMARICYNGYWIEVNAEIAENLGDVLLNIHELGGSYTFFIGSLCLWVSPGVPILIEFPEGFTPTENRSFYLDVIAATRQ